MTLSKEDLDEIKKAFKKEYGKKKGMKVFYGWEKKKMTYKSSPKSKTSIVVKKGERKWI